MNLLALLFLAYLLGVTVGYGIKSTKTSAKADEPERGMWGIG